MEPTVLPAVVAETYITSNAIDLSGQKSVNVRSYTDSVAGHDLDNLADGNDETYWMSNDSNDAVKRLEFHFEVSLVGLKFRVSEFFFNFPKLGSDSFLQFVNSKIKRFWT